MSDKKEMKALLEGDMDPMPMGQIFSKHRDYINKYILPRLPKHGYELHQDIARFTDVERVKFTEELLHAVHDECSEILGWLPWKHWKDYDPRAAGQVDIHEVRFEVIDLLHFVFNLAMVWGMTFYDVEIYYQAKLKENIRRQEDGY
jgi:hypothetical protein